MKIQAVREGELISFAVNGTVITFGSGGSGELTLDAAEHEADREVVVDVTRRQDGSLGLGVPPGSSYVATVVIPPRRYREVETGERDEDDNPLFAIVPQPLDPQRIVVHLWPQN